MYSTCTSTVPVVLRRATQVHIFAFFRTFRSGTNLENYVNCCCISPAITPLSRMFLFYLSYLVDLSSLVFLSLIINEEEELL